MGIERNEIARVGKIITGLLFCINTYSQEIDVKDSLNKSTCLIIFFEEGVELDDGLSSYELSEEQSLLYNSYFVLTNSIDTYITATISCKMSNSQIAAISSLIYSIGKGNFENSYLCSAIRLCDHLKNREKIREGFVEWVKLKGKPSPMLQKRRITEFKLFFEE